MSRWSDGRRVLMIVENNPVPSDRRVWQEASALRDAGCRVTVVSPRHARARRLREMIDGIEVIRHPRLVEAARSWEYALEYANAIFWEMAISLFVMFSRGVDVVHIANPPDTAFILAPLFRLTGARVIFDQHDLSPEIYEEKFRRRGLLWWALRAAERASYRAADMVITPNESMRRLAISRGGLDPQDVQVVRNGPDTRLFAEVSPEPSRHNGHAHRVCYMGIIGEQEGLDGYIRVIDDIVHRRGRTDTEFLIVGDGTGLPALKERARRAGLSRNVRFTGYLTGEELASTVGSADVCVVPEPATPLTESSTLVKTMEYMALAKPVVQYDLEEARVTSGDTAVYARQNDEQDLADKIVWLLDNPETRAELGERAARRVRDKLAWEHQVPNLLASYETVSRRRP
jgi:glycosyltransferase involved in cell wall biosynthesis